MASCQWSPPHTSAPDLNLPPVKGRVKKLPLFSSNLLLSLPLRALVVMCEIHSYNQSLLLNLFLKSEIGFGSFFPLDCHSLVGSSWCTKILHIFCTRSLKQITSLGALQCNALHSDGQTSVWQLSYNQPQPNYRHSDSSDPDNQLLTPQPTHFLIRTQILISIKSFQITLSSEITLLVSFKPLLPVFFWAADKDGAGARPTRYVRYVYNLWAVWSESCVILGDSCDRCDVICVMLFEV